MKKEKKETQEQQLAVSTEGLMQLVQAGRHTAVEIGLAAGARIQIGRRVLWNVARVQRYLDTIAS